jgi:hypothetical protein
MERAIAFLILLAGCGGLDFPDTGIAGTALGEPCPYPGVCGGDCKGMPIQQGLPNDAQTATSCCIHRPNGPRPDTGVCCQVVTFKNDRCTNCGDGWHCEAAPTCGAPGLPCCLNGTACVGSNCRWDNGNQSQCLVIAPVEGTRGRPCVNGRFCAEDLHCYPDGHGGGPPTCE